MRSEFDFIQNLKKKFSLGHIGDDCAVLPKDAATDIVLTSDMLIEDIDFRLDWTTPESLGHKVLAASLSDVAAMGANPKWALLSIGVPRHVWKGDFLDRFYDGWFELAGKHRVELVGGDVSRTPDKIVLDCTVGGEVKAGSAILREGAKVGDAIFVTGALGGAAGGLRLLEQGAKFDPRGPQETRELLDRQLRPNPQLETAKALHLGNLASAMIDISDGFSSDLQHLCDASSVGAIVDDIPVDKNLLSHFDVEGALQMALHGGEDFELLFTVHPEAIALVDALPVTRVGLISADVGEIEFGYGDRSGPLLPAGFRHF